MLLFFDKSHDSTFLFPNFRKRVGFSFLLSWECDTFSVVLEWWYSHIWRHPHITWNIQEYIGLLKEHLVLILWLDCEWCMGKLPLLCLYTWERPGGWGECGRLRVMGGHAERLIPGLALGTGALRANWAPCSPACSCLFYCQETRSLRKSGVDEGEQNKGPPGWAGEEGIRITGIMWP